MKLYSYFRSSAAYRVRIALNLKGLSYDYAPVHLLRHGGEQLGAAYRAVNPDGIVPALVTDDGEALSQSLAIIEYLDETFPAPPLLPQKPADRAYVRAIAMQIACEIHPLNNTRVQKYLKDELHIDDAAKDAWYARWVEGGFATLEARLAGDPRVGALCFGNAPTLADCCLVPQVFNARRFHVDMGRYPTIERIADHAATLDAFHRAAPAQQPDAE